MLKDSFHSFFVLPVLMSCLTLFFCQIAEGGVENVPNSTLPGAEDCVKCHFGKVAEIKARGGAHRDKLKCLDCHKGTHPPAGGGFIPRCSRCHTGRPHFEIDGCLSCHRAHSPKNITLTTKITDACITCHTEQIEQLRQNLSIHSKLACTACHNKHGQIPECQRCHKPHAAEGIPQTCTKCHPAHKPLRVVYGKETASEICQGCHAKVYSLLKGSQYKHANLSCATCHQERHKVIPKCSDCHGKPHSDELMGKFTTCGDCHGKAHDLYRSATATANATDKAN